MTIATEILLDTYSVPQKYQNYNKQSLPDYDVIVLTKSEPDEKDISCVSVRLHGPSRDVRVGWLIPAISLRSNDHDFNDNIHFINYASHLFGKFENNTVDERTYFFIWYKKNAEDYKINIPDYILDFTTYGIYPFEKNYSKYRNSLSSRVTKATLLKKRFNHLLFKGFVRDLYSNILQDETNLYARFMHIYQVIELSMDLALQAKMMEFKDSRKHIGIIREKLNEYFRESKLISTVYDFTDKNKDLTNIRLAANEKLKTSTGKNYNEEEKNVAIYDFRNMLVHNYYRFKDDIDISLFCDHIEHDALDILTAITEANYYKSELESRYHN